MGGELVIYLENHLKNCLKKFGNMKVTFGQVRIPSGSELASGEDICAHMTHTEVKKMHDLVFLDS